MSEQMGFNPLVAGAIGLVIGIAITIAAIMVFMPGMMVQATESSMGFDETVAAIEAAAAEQGWTVQSVVNMNNSLAKHGRTFAPQVRVMKICQPEYAESILTTDRNMAVMMPCSLAVYETDDGSVMVSQMNAGLMGTLFGGNVAAVMGGKVSPDVADMLDGILK